MEILTRDTPASQAQSIETSSYWSLPILSSFMAESWRRPLRLVSVFLEQYLLDAMPAHGNDCDFVSLAPEGIALLRNFAEHMGDPSVHAVEKKRQAARERKQGKNSHVRLPPAFRLRVCFLFRQTQKAFLSLSLLFPRLGALLPAPNAANAPGTSPMRSPRGCVLVLRLFLGWLGDLLFPKKPLPFSKKEARLAEAPPFPAGEPKSRRMLRPAKSAMADANFCRP